jgi:hypothetical protein
MHSVRQGRARRAIVVGWVVVGLLSVCGTVAGGDAEEQSALGVRFATPVPFSAPESIGMGAVALSHPPDAGPGEVACEIVLCHMPAAMREAMGGEDGSLLEYAKSTFLGTSRPAEGSVERVILGAPSTGQTLSSKIPRPGRLEVHLVPLADGARLAVAVRTFGDASADLGETVMATLAGSLAEEATDD